MDHQESPLWNADRLTGSCRGQRMAEAPPGRLSHFRAARATQNRPRLGTPGRKWGAKMPKLVPKKRGQKGTLRVC